MSMKQAGTHQLNELQTFQLEADVRGGLGP